MKYRGIKPKQETLEEAAEDYGNSIGNKDGTAQFDFIKGAKWQQEQDKNKYSEEEVLSMLRSFDSNFNQDELKESILKKWFEQFKKK
jgi:hypothetical protein